MMPIPCAQAPYANLHTMKFSHFIRSSIFALSVSTLGCAYAEPVTVGQALPRLAIQDQHEQSWQMTNSTHLLILATNRSASGVVQNLLNMQDKHFLSSRHALYAADLSRMPGLITRSFALPALRELAYPVGIVMNGKLLKDWPRHDKAVSLLWLNKGTLERIEFAQDDAQLRLALGL